MEPEVTVNLTVGLVTIHPCYEVGHTDHTVKNTPSAMCVLLCIFLAILSVIIICGNLLVIVSIIYFKQLHTPTNYLIVSLAVTDLLTGMIVFPFNIAFPKSVCTYYTYIWTVFCKIRDYADTLLTTCSVLNLGCISIDRYYAVCHPLTYRTKMSRHVVAIMILVSWGFPAIYLNWNIGNRYFPCHDFCSLFFHITVLLIGFLPLIIMMCIFCIYLKIFIVAQRQVRSIQNKTCQSTKSGATVSKMERKATKTLAIVLGVYLLCWFPYLVRKFMIIIASNLTPDHAIETIVWIKLLNSMLNPFIYAVFYSWFRSAIRMIISGRIFQGDFTNSQLH